MGIALAIALGGLGILGGGALLLRTASPSLPSSRDGYDADEEFKERYGLNSKGGTGDTSPRQSVSGSSMDSSIPGGDLGARDYILEKPNLPPLSSSSAISSREEFRPRADKVGSMGNSKFERRYYDDTSSSDDGDKKEDKKEKGVSPLTSLVTWLAKMLAKLSSWIIMAVVALIIWLIKKENK
jgi:hypothetical protein